MTADPVVDPPQQSRPFNEVLGPVAATGHLNPKVQIGLAVHQGAFPSGQDLEAMERHSPGAVGRILSMAEKAQQAQIEAGTLAQEYARADVQRGQWMGATLTVLAIFGAGVEGIWGNPWVAGAIVGVPVFAAIGKVVDSARTK